MKEFKAILLLILALATTYLATVNVAQMWHNVGLIELLLIVFVFYAVWNVREIFGHDDNN
jgi:hypothetical protein